jgi:MFS family permease
MASSQESGMDDAVQPGNLRTVAATSFLSGLTQSMTQAVWQPFALSVGASMSILGLLESLGGLNGLVTNLVQPLGGWLSDRLGRKPLIALGGLAMLAAVSCYLVAARMADWLWLLPGAVLLGLSLIASPAHRSLIAESAPAHRRGRAYGTIATASGCAGIFF